MTPDQVFYTTASTLAELDSTELFQLKADATDLLSMAQAIVEHIDRALELKYADRAKAMLEADGKDAGVVHFDDGSVRVTAELPELVEWDQELLAEIAHRITNGGEDPAEYIEISYHISKAKFDAWPDSLKKAFLIARIAKLGKPQFRLALIGEHDES